MTTTTTATWVREMHADEFGEICDLLETAYREYAGVLSPDVYGVYLADLLDPGTDATILVVGEPGRLVGTARLYLDASTEGLGLPAAWAGVRAVGVLPGHRGAGIGRALMIECAARSTAAGAPALCLHTAAFMPTAIRLYEDLGYRRAPEWDLDATAHYGVQVEEPLIALAYRLDLSPESPQ